MTYVESSTIKTVLKYYNRQEYYETKPAMTDLYRRKI